MSYLLAHEAFGQASADAGQEVRLDEAPWADARSQGLSRAIGPIANGIEAPYYNPAGIGGQYRSKDQPRPAITRLTVPHFALGLHDNSSRILQQMSDGKGLQSQGISDEILETQVDKRHYARVSVVPNIQFYRMFLGYAYDQQFAAVSRNEDASEIDLEMRTSTGLYTGFSLADEFERFIFGVTVGHASRTVTAGTFSFAEIEAPADRRQAFSDHQHRYDGLPIHTGVIWRIRDEWNPSFSLVARDLGGTRYRNRNQELDDLIAEEDLSLGFALSPRLEEWGYVNIVMEGSHLTENDTSLAKKMRMGLELTLGNQFGSEAGLSLQTGLSAAGLSFGCGIQAGILSFHLASYAEDVGIANRRVIERRHMANFAVNVAAF